jgi:CBS domain containing-hemolysin-like protein
VGDEVDLGEFRAKVLTLQQRRIGQVLLTPSGKTEG